MWDVAILTAMATSADPATGTADDDVLAGIDGIRNSLSGDTGNDTLIGGNVDDILDGGAGDDTVIGGEGNDTYVFNVGDGVDHIEDNKGSNTVQFGPGITPDMLTLGLGSLLIRVGANGDAIHLDDFDPNDVLSVPSVDTFRFDDGTDLSYDNLIARGFDIFGTGGNDFLAGTNIDDRFDGGAGDDALAGGAGNDTYAFGLGSGQDRIEDFDATAGNSDILRIGAGVLPDDLVISRNNSDLLVSISGTQDQVAITNWFKGGANKIERVTFVNGTEWDAAILEGKVIATNTSPSVASAIGVQATLELAPKIANVVPATADDTTGSNVPDENSVVGAETIHSTVAPSTFIGAYNVLTPVGENAVATQPTESSSSMDNSLAPGAADTVTSANENSDPLQTPDDSLQQEIQARIDNWFGNVYAQQPINLSDFDRVRDRTFSATLDESRAVTYNMAQWNGIEMRLPLHLAEYAESGLDLASENLFSTAFANPLVDAAPVANVVGLSPTLGIDLKPLKGLSEGLSKLDYA